tara:strand:- start:317 stop:1414 length:1098 start_codon:yes stop_codon:yes gene_type:complete
MVFPEVGGTLNIYGGIFSEREEVILVATPNEFFEFESWSGSEEGEDSILTFIMDDNKTIYAEFKKIDTDGDGYSDDIDLCNDTPPGIIVNNKGCPSMEADYDNDGIINENDICSNTPENTSVSTNGCPLIYLDDNGVTLKATDEAIDSTGKIILFEGDEILIVKDWKDIRSLDPPNYEDDLIVVTTFLNRLEFFCSRPCTISDNFDLSSWDMSNVKSMYFTFWNTDGFDQDISKWDVSNVEDMEGLFFYTNNLNVDLSLWNVSKVKNMKMMFRDAFYANPNVTMWDVSNVVDMKEMFYGSDIDQNLKPWNVKKVLNMDMMFYGAKYFNQDLSIWEVDNVENCSNFFDGATKWDLPKPNFINCDPN